MVQTHPTFPNIFMTGDYEGQIILWDASTGTVVKIFEEKFDKSGEIYAQSNPILEAQFFPNGLQFIISTYYGKISLYGYGAFHDVALQPDEQFFEKDLMRENIIQNEIEPEIKSEISMIQEPPIIIYDHELELKETKKLNLKMIHEEIDQEEEKKKMRQENLIECDKKETINLNEIITAQEIQDDLVEAKDKISEIEEEDHQGFEEEAESSKNDFVNQVGLNNLTRGFTNLHNQSEISEDLAIINKRLEDSNKNVEKKDRGHFCDSKLIRHNDWNNSALWGYFEWYQDRIKDAKNKELNLIDYEDEMQKKFMEIYISEKEKIDDFVKVESESPLIPHLIDKLGLLFKKKEDKKLVNEEFDNWESDDEEDEKIGIVPRRRRRYRGSYGNNHRMRIDPPIQERPKPIHYGVMTRAREREMRREEQEQKNNSFNSLNNELDQDLRQKKRRNIKFYSSDDDEEDMNQDQMIQETKNNTNSINGTRQLEYDIDNDEDSNTFPKNSLSKSNITDGKDSVNRRKIVASFQEKKNLKTKICYNCKEEIFEAKKKCNECFKVFHSINCKDEGMYSFSHEILCLECYLKKKKEDKQVIDCFELKKFSLSDLNRETFYYDDTISFDQNKNIFRYELTDLDEVYIIPGMFKNFIKHFAPIIPPESINFNFDLLIGSKEDLLVKIINVDYSIPKMKFKYENENFIKNGELMLFQIVTAQIIEGNINELRSKNDLLPIQGGGNLINYR